MHCAAFAGVHLLPLTRHGFADLYLRTEDLMKSRNLGLVATGLLALPVLGNADTIVDTGAPTGCGTGCGNTGAEMRAGLFKVDSAIEIKSIQQFVQVPGPLTVTFTVRTDAGGMPGDVLFATEAILLANTEYEWEGVSGLSWALPAGTYWVTMEDRDPEAMARFTRLFGAETATYPDRPLVAEAVGFAPDFDKWEVAIAKTGWRILGSMATDAD